MTERLALFFGLQVAFGIDPLGLLRRERSSLEPQFDTCRVHDADSARHNNALQAWPESPMYVVSTGRREAVEDD